MNNVLRTYAPDWTPVQNAGGKIVNQELDTAGIDGIWVEFLNKEQLVKIHCNHYELKEFGKAPVGNEQAHYQRVLRAILETYIEKFGGVPPDISEKDLVRHLYPLQIQFRKELGNQ